MIHRRVTDEKQSRQLRFVLMSGRESRMYPADNRFYFQDQDNGDPLRAQTGGRRLAQFEQYDVDYDDFSENELNVPVQAHNTSRPNSRGPSPIPSPSPSHRNANGHLRPPRPSSLGDSERSSSRRYLYPKKETVETLRPEEVRWMYREEGGKRWEPFIGYDSLRIECKHRELIHGASQRPDEVDNVEMIVVRGGLYECDVVSRKCYPIYWTGATADITRGTWFLDGQWQPIEEGYAAQIETEHLAKFEGQKITELEPSPHSPKNSSPEYRVVSTAIHNIKFKEFHVDWNSIVKVFLYYEDPSSRLYRAVGNKLGLSKSGTRLHRGFQSEATMDDKPPDITHLVFVIHGIGQKMETGKIIRCCSELRENVSRLKNKFYPELDALNQRAEFLPVEWRSSLKLDGDTVDSITPNKVRGLRTMLNSSAMDILYYTSPLYRSEITQGLQTELNRLYGMFCARHPYFEACGGKVSIIAHSLGCVITYDIITGWNPIQLYDQYVSSIIDEQAHADYLDHDTHRLLAELEKARKRVGDLERQLMGMSAQQHLKTPTLKFKLQNFFCLGSPLAVFLALRGVRPKNNGTQDNIIPTSLCARIFNIYHPADPVAYRVEPLALKHYATLCPLTTHRCDTIENKTPYSLMKPVPVAAILKELKKQQEDRDKEREEREKEREKEKEKENELALQNAQQTKSAFSVFHEKMERARKRMHDEAENDDKNTVAESPTTKPEPNLEKVETKDGDKPSPKSPSGKLDKVKSWNIWGRWGKKEKKEDDKAKELSAELQELEKMERVVEEMEEREAQLREKEKIEEEDMYSPDTMEQTELEYRLDYVLREGNLESSYISAITSHTSYWANQDVSLFLLQHLHPEYLPN